MHVHTQCDTMLISFLQALATKVYTQRLIWVGLRVELRLNLDKGMMPMHVNS